MSAFRAVVIAAIGLAVSLLYFARLDWSPPYLSIDEVPQARQAMTLAATGRSVSGQLFPLYFGEPGYLAGRDPIWIYATAALLKRAPFSEVLVRVPSALAGVVDVVLMFFLARRVFGSDLLAVAGALFLALAPAHFFHSRLATSQIGPVAFVLAWLIFMARYLESDRRRDLFAATFCLGLGIYAYLGAAVMLPVYFAATLAVVAMHLDGRSRPRTGFTSVRGVDLRDVGIACAGLAVALLPWAWWHIVHPERFRQLIDYYASNEGYKLGLKTFWGAAAVTSHLDAWWNSFDPSRVFFTSDSSLRYSTREAGYLLLATLPLVAIGVFQLRRCLKRELRFLVAVGLIFGPLPAALVGELDLKRWLTVLPFAALAATCGVQVVLRSRRRAWQASAIALSALCFLQFGGFVRDYWGPYRARASFYLGGNLRGAIAEALTGARDPGCMFWDTRIPTIKPYWDLYTRAFDRDDFAGPINSVDSEGAAFAPPRNCKETRIVVLQQDVLSYPAFRDKLKVQGWTGTMIPEPDGRPTLAVYRHLSQ